MDISVVVPCFNEEEALPFFYEKVTEVMSKMNLKYEILLIDDGSTDQTLNYIKKISCEDEAIVGISFSRNYGKEAAMYAGFCNAQGDYVVVMDADMQDPPSLLPEMYEIIQNQEFDSVATRRATRSGEPRIRSWFAKKFYTLINKISDAEIMDGARDFRLMKREMVDAIIAMKEYNRFSKGIFGWIGFKTYWLSYDNVERVAGTTKWSFWKLLKYAIDGIISFSEMPLSIASWFGIITTIGSFFFLLFVVIRRLLFGDPVAGWASIVSVILFMSGIQLLCIGIIGQYLSKNYKESKNRPHYIAKWSNKADIKKIM